MRPEQIYEFLKKVRLFKDLTDDELRLVAENSQVINLKTSEHLFDENAPRKNLYLIFKGEIELFKKPP